MGEQKYAAIILSAGRGSRILQWQADLCETHLPPSSHVQLIHLSLLSGKKPQHLPDLQEYFSFYIH